jgi:hypothetical protein
VRFAVGLVLGEVAGTASALGWLEIRAGRIAFGLP